MAPTNKRSFGPLVLTTPASGDYLLGVDNVTNLPSAFTFGSGISVSGGVISVALPSNSVTSTSGTTAGNQLVVWSNSTGVEISKWASTGIPYTLSGVVTNLAMGTAAQFLMMNAAATAPVWNSSAITHTGTVSTVTVIAGTTTWNIPPTATAVIGVVNLSAQTLGAGLKTFTNDIALTATAGGTTSGQIWNDSTQKSIASYTSGIKSFVPGLIFRQTASQTVTNIATAVTLFGTGIGTLTLPANFFVIGKSIKILLAGIYSTPIGTPSATITVKLGSTTIATVTTTSLLASASGLRVCGEINITCRTTGASGTVMTDGYIEYATGVTGTIAKDPLNNGGAATTFDSTTSKVLDVTITWDSATSTRIATTTIGEVWENT